jgi:hypothetical protein
MRKQLNHRSMRSHLLATILLALVVAGCDNEMNIGPTAPQLPNFPPTGNATWTLHISGSLAAANGSLLSATVLFDGQEIAGARIQCEKVKGCAQLELEGIVSTAFRGHHPVTFQVLRQAAENEDYLASGIVEVSRVDAPSLDPLVIQLEPIQATLQAGEGVTFDIEFWE